MSCAREFSGNISVDVLRSEGNVFQRLRECTLQKMTMMERDGEREREREGDRCGETQFRDVLRKEGRLLASYLFFLMLFFNGNEVLSYFCFECLFNEETSKFV